MVHQVLESGDFGLELLRIGRCKETHEIKYLLILSLEILNSIQLKDICEVDHGRHFNTKKDASLSLIFDLEGT